MESIVLENARQLAVGPAEARAAVIRALRAQEFTLTSEQVSWVSAKRGSQMLGSVQAQKLPITAKITFHPHEGGSLVMIRLADAWRSGVKKMWGMNDPYRSVLSQVQQYLDQALAPIALGDANVSANDVSTSTGDARLLSRANVALGRAGGAVVDKADDLLDGPSSGIAAKHFEGVVLRSQKGVATLERDRVLALFTVGLLVSRTPGSMPANLASDVEALSARLETAVHQQPKGQLVIEIAESETPVAEFLGQQAAIRERLPLRTLQVCTACKFEKVVNPDFQKLQERNRRKQALTGAVGATVTRAGISPFFLVGSLLKLKSTEAQFVCPRCQGLDADMSVITYCPQCGDRRGEAVLRRCAKCRHNFGADVASSAEFWSPGQPVGIEAPADTVSANAANPPSLAEHAAVVSSVTAPPGWHADFTGRHQHRWWDGGQWTWFVSDNGVQGQDPF